MLNEEHVTVIAGGRVFDRWERVQVTAAINEAARQFSLETTEYVGEFNFAPGTPCQVLANGDLLVDGYINSYEASGDEKSHRVNVKGRSRAQDAIDSSAEHETGYFEEQTPEQHAKALDKFGIGFQAKVPLRKVPYAQIKQGETVFKFVERYLREQGATMMGMPDGSVEITNGSVARSVYGILLEGHTIKSFQVSLTDGGRHSKYIVKGQNRLGTGSASLRIRQQASDKGVKRNRTKIIAQETDTDPSRAKERAEHERDRAAGKSIAAAVQTQGFRDFAGKLFEPNTLIYVHSPVLMKLAQAMLIERVEFSQDRGGSLTQLTLVDPRAYKGKPQSSSAIDEPDLRELIDDGGAETGAPWTEGYD